MTKLTWRKVGRWSGSGVGSGPAYVAEFDGGKVTIFGSRRRWGQRGRREYAVTYSVVLYPVGGTYVNLGEPSNLARAKALAEKAINQGKQP